MSARLAAVRILQFTYRGLAVLWVLLFLLNIPYTWYTRGFRQALAIALPLSSAGVKLYLGMAFLFLPVIAMKWLSDRLLASHQPHVERRKSC